MVSVDTSVDVSATLLHFVRISSADPTTCLSPILQGILCLVQLQPHLSPAFTGAKDQHQLCCGNCGTIHCGTGPRRDWPKWRDHLPCTADFGCSRPPRANKIQQDITSFFIAKVHRHNWNTYNFIRAETIDPWPCHLSSTVDLPL